MVAKFETGICFFNIFGLFNTYIGPGPTFVLKWEIQRLKLLVCPSYHYYSYHYVAKNKGMKASLTIKPYIIQPSSLFKLSGLILHKKISWVPLGSLGFLGVLLRVLSYKALYNTALKAVQAIKPFNQQILAILAFQQFSGFQQLQQFW